jgi:hypothetical protein
VKACEEGSPGIGGNVDVKLPSVKQEANGHRALDSVYSIVNVIS